MRYKNSINFGLILVLVGMCISLIINYYINILEIENIITPSHETSTFSKSEYETSILNPQYFFTTMRIESYLFRLKAQIK